MTIIDQFITFTNGLPSDRMESVEEALAALMESFSAEYDFTLDELAELDRRAADPNPNFADSARIAELFGKPFAG